MFPWQSLRKLVLSASSINMDNLLLLPSLKELSLIQCVITDSHLNVAKHLQGLTVLELQQNPVTVTPKSPLGTSR